MNNEIEVRILTYLLTLTLMPVSKYPLYKFDENAGVILQINDQPVQNVTFMLLAIEQDSNLVSLKSAQHLIKTLSLFNNWKNGTTSAGFRYLNFIRLLSNIPFHDIDPECRAYYMGNVTRANVVREISILLDQALINEENFAFSVLILYFIGETNKALLNGTTSYYMALDKPIYDWELNQILQSKVNNSNTLIILDTCYSGGYLSKLNQPGRAVLAACNPNEKANRWISSQDGEQKYEGWFTGHENASFNNKTCFGPLGVIGGILNATDINKDGWRSAGEIFQFASQTTMWYCANQTNTENQAPYGQRPWASYGLAGGEIPIIQYEESKPFSGKAKECSTRPILFASSRYNISELEHRMYRQSLSRSGFAPTKGPEKPSILWISSLNESVTTSPAVAEGMVFVGTLGGKFYALDVATGEIVWIFNTDSPISSSPAVIDGIVFFGTEEPGKVYALDSYSGLARWVYEVPDGAAVYSSPAIFSDMVFVGCADRYLRCLSKFEGNLLWTTYIGGEKLSSPAILDNMIFVTSPYVYAVDVFTGKLLWTYKTNWAVISSPAVADGLVFVGSQNDDKAFALEQDTGKLVWSFRTGGWLTSPAVDSAKRLVVLGCRDARIYCLDEHTGNLQWEYVDGVNYLSAPTITMNGLVYVGSTNGNFYCIDEETGEEVWKYVIGAPIVSSPSVIYEHAFVASYDGKIHCFGAPFPTHDIAILNANVSSHKLKMGGLLEVSCTIKNSGSVEENVVILCCKNGSNVWTAPQHLEPIIIHSENVTITSGANFIYMYSWNTSNEIPGLYSISIQAHLVPDEIDASDNTYIVNTVMIIAPSDIDANGEVNIIDVAIAARAYGSTSETPLWNESADINKDGIINIMDIALVAHDFGKIYI
ncbi:MAG: PQQ-binding-like beta-propeller repeat protein [Candidatus Bathyarchaeota archaeon]|nr:PQQ-binding-like beta-propeller repeat protein [Candidatus Bathyarchaeota archaeon]